MADKNSLGQGKSENMGLSLSGDDSEALEKLCLLIEEVEQLCEKLIAIGDFGPVVQELQQICEKLLTAIENLDQLVECIQELKESIATLCDKIDGQTEILNNIEGCLAILKELEVECCEIPQDPENRDRWCQNWQTFPVGNGADNTTLSVSVGGANAALPNPYTEADLIAALTTLAPNAGWSVVNGQLCRFDAAGSVTGRSVTCFERQKSLAQFTSVQLFVAGDAPEKQYFLRVKDKNSDAIANGVENINTTLSDIEEKLCNGQVDCLTCTVFNFEPETIIANPIIQQIDGTGQAQELANGPFSSVADFANELTALGYTTELIGNQLTVCGVDLLIGVVLEDETVISYSHIDNKQGQLVCDPVGNAALCAKLDTNNNLLSQVLTGILCLKDLLTCVEDEDITCPVVATVDNFNYIQTDAPTTFTFPTPLSWPNPIDFTADVTVNCDDVVECFGDCSNLILRYTIEHQQLGPNHTGFILSSGSANAQAIAVSANNTAASASNNSFQQIGTAAGDPDDTGFVTRWVEFSIPADEVCKGLQLATGGQNGFDNAGIFDESVNSVKVEVVGCN